MNGNCTYKAKSALHDKADQSENDVSTLFGILGSDNLECVFEVVVARDPVELDSEEVIDSQEDGDPQIRRPEGSGRIEHEHTEIDGKEDRRHDNEPVMDAHRHRILDFRKVVTVVPDPVEEPGRRTDLGDKNDES